MLCARLRKASVAEAHLGEEKYWALLVWKLFAESRQQLQWLCEQRNSDNLENTKQKGNNLNHPQMRSEEAVGGVIWM